MADTKVDVIARLAQWKVQGLLATNFLEQTIYYGRKSDPFKINGWDWRLYVETNPLACIRLSSEPFLSLFYVNRPSLARVVIRVTGANCRSYTSPIFEDVQNVRTSAIDMNWESPFVISVEFLDLSMRLLNGRVSDKIQDLATRSSSKSFSHMLNESVHADITIFTSDGKLQAHKAILSASSPVFRSMFTHDLKEKVSSTIEMQDMTSESCMTLLRFMYGSIKHEEFWKHRLALLGAANKYDITDLKDACVESLLEDINADNVLDRLQEAWLYELGELKSECFRYLLDFGQIHRVSREKMRGFLRQADRALVVEMFEKMLVAGVAPSGLCDRPNTE